MRSGYSDDLDRQDVAMWRGRVASSIRGKRGQQLLRDCLAALDAMPEKRLIKNYLVKDGEVCTLGAAGKGRGIDLVGVDPESHDVLAKQFNVAECLIQEIEWVNDEGGPYNGETPEHRFDRVRKWVVENIAANTGEPK